MKRTTELLDLSTGKVVGRFDFPSSAIFKARRLGLVRYQVWQCGKIVYPRIDHEAEFSVTGE